MPTTTMSDDSVLRNYRIQRPKIAQMAPGVRDICFATVFLELERRASSGDYTDITISNLGFFLENTCDSAAEAAKGQDEVRNLWNQKYGDAFKNLHWHFHCLRNFVKYSVSLLTAFPETWCTIHLDESDRVLEGGRFAFHKTCDDTDQGFRGCDICSLSMALDDCCEESELVEEVEREVGRWEKVATEYVEYGGVVVEFQTSWKIVEGADQFYAQRVSGQLGKVVEHDLEWTAYTEL